MEPDAVDTTSDEGARRAGRCAIVGRPNAGKSTLLNALLGQKLVIATHRPGTTRASVLAVYEQAEPPTQIAFVDTPGLHRPKSALGKVLLDQAMLGLAEADVILFLVQPPKKGSETLIHPEDERILELVERAGRPTILAINKVDLVKKKEALLPLLAAWGERFDFVDSVPISARKRTNLPPLVSAIRAQLAEGWLYEDDFFTDRPERFFVAELVREAVLERTRAEVPHGCATRVESWHETDKRPEIHVQVIVEKDSHKGIVIGARGARLKEIGIAARQRIERFVGRPVILKLWVKVAPGWTDKADQARSLATEVEG